MRGREALNIVNSNVELKKNELEEVYTAMKLLSESRNMSLNKSSANPYNDLTPSQSIFKENLNKLGYKKLPNAKSLNYNELEQLVKLEKSFLNSKSSTVRGMKQIIKERDFAFSNQFFSNNPNISQLKNVYNFLETEEYSKLKNVFNSDVVIKLMTEVSTKNKKTTSKSLKDSINNYLSDIQGKEQDSPIINDLINIINNNYKNDIINKKDLFN